MAGDYETLMQEARKAGFRVGLGRTNLDDHGPVDRLVVYRDGHSKAWVFGNGKLDAAAGRAVKWLREHASA